MFILCICVTIFYWLSGDMGLRIGYSGVVIKMAVMGAWLILAIGSSSKLLHNKYMDYLSGISMEVYLCHMMSFRAVQFLHISNYIHNMHLTYILTCILTLAVAICFSHIVKYVLLSRVETLIIKRTK